MKYRPDQCPYCGFVWGAYQGQNYQYGYEQLAANIWKCTRCGKKVKPRNSSHRFIAKN